MSLPTNQAYVDLMMRRLGSRTNLKLRADVVTDLNITRQQLDYGNFHPWFLEESVDLTLQAGVERVLLPPDFVMEIEDREVIVRKVQTGDRAKLTKRTANALDRWILGNDGEGFPSYYTIETESFRVYPPADGDYVVSLHYYKETTEITDGPEEPNLWLKYAANLIIGLAGVQLAAFTIKDPSLEQTFAAMAVNAKQDLVALNEIRRNANLNFSSDIAHFEEMVE